MNQQVTEADIIAAGADKAARITPDHIAATIVSEHYFTAGEGVIGAFAAEELRKSGGDVVVPAGAANPDLLKPSLNLLTFCVLVLKNGFTVTGESACASPANFNAQIGQRIARENAVNKIWLLEGYLLKERLNFQA